MFKNKLPFKIIFNTSQKYIFSFQKNIIFARCIELSFNNL